MKNESNIVEFKDFMKGNAGNESIDDLLINLNNMGNASNENNLLNVFSEEKFESTLDNEIYPLMSAVQKEYTTSLEAFALMGASMGNDDVRLYGEISMLYYNCGIVANMFESKTYLHYINILSTEPVHGYDRKTMSETLAQEAIETASKLKEMVAEFESRTGKQLHII